MNKRKLIKSVVMLASSTLIISITVGGTLSYIVASDGPVSKVFAPSEIETVIDYSLSESDGSYFLTSSSNVDIFARISFDAAWITADGNVYAEQSVTPNDYAVVVDPDCWTQAGDYYYCTIAIKPGESTSDISIVQYADSPEGCVLNIEVTAEVIQAADDSITNSEWEYNPAVN